jgi:hypothetical protein
MNCNYGKPSCGAAKLGMPCASEVSALCAHPNLVCSAGAEGGRHNLVSGMGQI